MGSVKSAKPIRFGRASSPARGQARPPARSRTSRYLGLVILAVIVAAPVVGAYYYVSVSRLIDTRLRGERVGGAPRIFARPYDLQTGQRLGLTQLVERLNDLGYVHRPRVEHAGEFAVGRGALALIPRKGSHQGATIRVVFEGGRPSVPAGSAGLERITRIEIVGAGSIRRLELGMPLLTALATEGREKRRRVPLAAIPPRVVAAVLAIEDRRFRSHPGVDVVRTAGALVTNMRGDRPYLVGGSTITQQLVKNFFLTPEKSIRRKLAEQFMALVLERRASKDEILELYLNEVYLGQRGSFAVHGVGEGSRLFFGKDVSNLTLAEAATLAGVIQAPSQYSPARFPDRARARRNVVLQAMADVGSIPADVAARASREPLRVAARGVDAEAPYFVDFVRQTLDDEMPEAVRGSGTPDVYTTLDLHLQRLAQEAMRQGLARIDQQLVRGGRRTGAAQGAFVAVDPRTGEILALLGGRLYTQSQFNRAVGARRQPGSVFKPFVYLAAFERGVAEGRIDLTPATLVMDEPTTFAHNSRDYTPANYRREYSGYITWRQALSLSRNVATVKVAETAGYDRVAALWHRIAPAAAARPYPSIALGVFEATPLEVAEAYTVFANGGQVRPLTPLAYVRAGDGRTLVPPERPPRTVARPDTTYLVTHMMQSVLDEGTGAAARAAGLAAAAAGKSGTTNDLRDAWFVGFTPDLLAAVWVGFDDNQPLGLSGAQAALPIWTDFMRAALAGRGALPFEQPDGITLVEIDPETGLRAGRGCRRPVREAFLTGSEPAGACGLHRFR